MKIFTVVIILAASVTPLAAQWIDHPTPGIPRTANGKLNLTAPAPRMASLTCGACGYGSAPIRPSDG